MCKIRFSFIVLAFFLVLSSNASMKRYEVKSGQIEYETIGEGSMMGVPTKMSGKSSVIFKNYGAIELMHDKTTQTIMGQKEIEEDITKFDNGTVYSVDHEEKVIFKQEVPVDLKDPMLIQKGKKSLESLGGKRIGTEKVAGFKCDVWQLKDYKMCIYKAVPLKMETNVMGIKQIQIAKTVKFNISISDEKFKLPNYPIKSMSDMMGENMKQMQEEMQGMTPEQKKMMQDMMKNMGQMFGGQQ